MQKELLTKISKGSQAHKFHLIALRGMLIREIAGNKLTTPTYYMKIKRELGITGSRRNIVKQLTEMIENDF
jgi:hypothetical protein